MTAWWALLAAVVGALVGAAAVLAWSRSRHAARVPDAAEDVPPLGEVAALLDVLPGACVLLDSTGAVLHATPEAVALDLVRDERLRLDEMGALAHQCSATRSVVEGELSVRRGPHTKILTDVHVRVAPLAHDRLLLTAEDLSDALRVEAVRRDFVANVSHELKTPVGALALLAEAVLAAKDDPEAVAHFAGRMQGEATRLGALVTDVIDLSRLQSADPMTPGEPVPVDGLVHEAVDAVRQLAQAKHIAVVRGGRTGLRVMGQETHLATALRNLLINAINYSPEHTRVAVVVHAADGMVEIGVTDQGMGIAPEDQERIFERFYRVDPARSRGTGGTGLGLAIVKHVCVNHGGEVTVWSRLGEGSTFTLKLPAEPATAGVGSSAPAGAAAMKERVP